MHLMKASWQTAALLCSLIIDGTGVYAQKLSLMNNTVISYGNMFAVGPNGKYANVTFTLAGAPVGPNGIPSSVNTKPITWKASNVMLGRARYHLIYYGTGGYFNDNRRKILQDFLDNFHESSWYLVAKKYGIGTWFADTTTILDCTTSAYGCYLKELEIPHLIADLIDGGINENPGEFLVVLGKEVTEEVNIDIRMGRDYCAYHSHFVPENVGRPPDGTKNNYKYAVIQVPNRDPITLPASIAKESGMTIKPASACFINRNRNDSPNGEPEMDQVIPLAAHELVEILISPTARHNYKDEDLNEAMDKCVPWIQGIQRSSDNTYDWNAQIEGRKYLLPSIWDPELQACSIGTDPSGTFSKNWVKIGCYSDSSKRALSEVIRLSNISLESCLAVCASKGYNFAGAGAGTECWCGNSINNGHAPVPETECNIKCTRTKKKCGGLGRLSMYRLADWNYAGCYEDGESRTLESATYLSREAMTIEICQSHCASQGYHLAGLQSGNECYCGNSLNLNRGLRPDGECSTSCAGNPMQKCGGSLRLSLYRTVGMGFDYTGYLNVRPLHKQNYCLEQPGGTMNNFVQLQATTCEATNANQRLQYDRLTQQIKVTNNGVKCLDTADASKVSINDCNSERNQNFLYNVTDQTFRLAHAPTKCLDVPLTGSGGELVRISSCNGATNQQFSFTSFATSLPNFESYVRILPRGKTNLCLNQPGGTLNNGDRMGVWECLAGGRNQRLMFDRFTSQIKITNHGVKCLEVHAFSTANGAHVTIFDCNNASNQKWILGADGTLRPTHAPGMCMDVPTSTNGDKIQLWTCNGGNNQKFDFSQFS